MTGIEMLAEFQKYLTISDPRLVEEERLESSEIYQFLNIAQRMVFKNKYFPSNNYVENIAIINANFEELKKLIVNIEINSGINNTTYYSNAITVQIRGHVENYAYYIKSESKVIRQDVFPTDPSGEVVPNQLISLMDVNRFISNSIHNPIIRQPAVLITNDNEVTVFVDKYTQYIGLYLTYLKYPNDIVDNEECELEKSLQGLVVTTAVDLFRSNKYLLAGQQQQQQQQQ